MSLALKLALAPLLVVQAVATRRRAPVLPEPEGPRQGQVGAGRVLRVLIVGDSSAAGVGVRTQDEALAGHLTRALARCSGRRVRWQLVAKSGITTVQALDLLKQSAPSPAEIAVVVLGVNDVIDQVPSHRAVQQRAVLVDWLREHAGVRHAVFAPLPPVHRFPLLPQPLRHVMGGDARRHDRAVARWAATRDDVSHLPIDYALGPEHMADDGFHPGEPVYRACGEALANHVAGRLITTNNDTETTP
ncbi:SGNH/GDSL hydrolase family protein [Rhizobacter sp. AJA081-3]|uniref:SGNH/GDSL hydrolase family protein n=1 Tax=Rhizobacter sp. AJA081-3 TaxID=2753607 RepID=UPI001ADFFCBD|nr:SGNH/GDSL hydrolase family protein [Rhizobacter sp. AJA081-3]QTN21860.1 SGNH/GDSL hydrolase family protein [Rhizobacter sp. AJA081-3]